MVLLVLLIPADSADVSLGTSNLETLGGLGVTSVSLARDDRTAAVILEGWALDPADEGAMRAALGASTSEVRALRPIGQIAVSTAPINSQGGL